MTSTVEYKGDLRTTCTHVRSGSAIETDAPVDNHGKGERFSPTDLMATSLATCMITVMGIKGKVMKIELAEIKVDVEKIMKADPRRISGIKLLFHFPEHLANIDNEKKMVLKQIGETCPVMQSIHPDIEVDIDWGAWK